MRIKNKWRLIQRISIGLIITSILLLLYPIIANYFADQERSQAVGNYDATISKMAKQQLEDTIKDAEAYNKHLFEAQQKGTSDTFAKAYKDVMPYNTVMGKIDIPAIDIKQMPFFHGTNQYVLEKGLGHIESTSIPVGGDNTHSVITGHSGVQNQKLFSDINKLEKGDVFYISIYQKKLMYRIGKIQVIDPDEVDKIKIEPGKDKVTLLTCTPAGINTHRLLVTGYREMPFVDAAKEHIIKRNFWSYEHIVIMLLILLVVIILIGFILKRRRKVKNEEN